VFGPEGFINAAVSIDTQPVDIDDATSDVIHTVSLDLPTGVTVRGGVNVTVTVNISPAPGQLVCSARQRYRPENDVSIAEPCLQCRSSFRTIAGFAGG
jgi:hypothetical protein